MSIKEEEWRPSVRGLDLLYLDGLLGSVKCTEAYNYHLNNLDDLARAKYLFGQHERLEIIKKERKEHKIEKEKNWIKHKQKIRCHSSSVDNYFECEND